MGLALGRDQFFGDGRGRGRRGDWDRGDREDRGDLDAPRVRDRAGLSSEKGQMPCDNRKLAYKGSAVCRDYNLDKCARAKGADSCKNSYGRILLHVCGTAKSVGRDGATSLCGAKHMHVNCPLRST